MTCHPLVKPILTSSWVENSNDEEENSMEDDDEDLMMKDDNEAPLHESHSHITSIPSYTIASPNYTPTSPKCRLSTLVYGASHLLLMTCILILSVTF